MVHYFKIHLLVQRTIQYYVLFNAYEESHFKTRTYSSLVTDHVYSLINTTSMNISSNYRCIKTSVSIMSVLCITITTHSMHSTQQISTATRCSKNRNNSTVVSLVFHIMRVRRVERLFPAVDLSQTIRVVEASQTEALQQ